MCIYQAGGRATELEPADGYLETVSNARRKASRARESVAAPSPPVRPLSFSRAFANYIISLSLSLSLSFACVLLYVASRSSLSLVVSAGDECVYSLPPAESPIADRYSNAFIFGTFLARPLVAAAAARFRRLDVRPFLLLGCISFGSFCDQLLGR